MSKSKFNITRIQYSGPHDQKGNTYPVYVINGALQSPYSQGSIYCTGCGERHIYRWKQAGPWVQFKCPTCGSTSARWEEEHHAEEVVKEGGQLI